MCLLNPEDVKKTSVTRNIGSHVSNVLQHKKKDFDVRFTAKCIRRCGKRRTLTSSAETVIDEI